MALIRYVIEVPFEIEYRIYLRNKLTCCGFNPILQTLKGWAASEFDSVICHVNSIEIDASADVDEFMAKIGNHFQDRGVDLDDTQQVLSALTDFFSKDYVGFNCIKTILQHLLVPASITDGHVR